MKHDEHSRRTRQGIARAREAGADWGANGRVLASRNRAEALEFAEALLPMLVELGAEGSYEPTAMTRKLNDRGIPSARGGRWHPTTVARLLRRLEPGFSEAVQEQKRRDQEAYLEEMRRAEAARGAAAKKESAPPPNPGRRLKRPKGGVQAS